MKVYIVTYADEQFNWKFRAFSNSKNARKFENSLHPDKRLTFQVKTFSISKEGILKAIEYIP